MQEKISERIEALGDALRARGLQLCTAESCTGGLVASTLTDVAGSSDWFRGAVVAYANGVKESALSVPREILMEHGAVSEPVVLAMVRGACAALGADCGVAVSGIAGPGGGTPDKPVGTVWMAWFADGEAQATLFRFTGGRAEVKAQTVRAAIEGLALRLEAGDGNDAAVCGSGAAD